MVLLKHGKNYQENNFPLRITWVLNSIEKNIMFCNSLENTSSLTALHNTFPLTWKKRNISNDKIPYRQSNLKPSYMFISRSLHASDVSSGQRSKYIKFMLTVEWSLSFSLVNFCLKLSKFMIFSTFIRITRSF